MSCNICEKPANFCCSDCDKAYYCGDDCQTLDWKYFHHKSCSVDAINSQLIGDKLSGFNPDDLFTAIIEVKKGEIFEIEGFLDMVLPCHWFIRKRENDIVQLIEKISEERDGEYINLLKDQDLHSPGLMGMIERGIQKLLPVSKNLTACYPVKFRLRAVETGETMLFAFQKNLIGKEDLLDSRLYCIRVV